MRRTYTYTDRMNNLISYANNQNNVELANELRKLDSKISTFIESKRGKRIFEFERIK